MQAAGWREASWTNGLLPLRACEEARVSNIMNFEWRYDLEFSTTTDMLIMSPRPAAALTGTMKVVEENGGLWQGFIITMYQNKDLYRNTRNE